MIYKTLYGEYEINKKVNVLLIFLWYNFDLFIDQLLVADKNIVSKNGSDCFYVTNKRNAEIAKNGGASQFNHL